jgi:hypothetical protein
MTQTLEIRHLRALFQSFAFVLHRQAVKLTTKNTKDTKNLLTVAARGWLSHNRNLADGMLDL